MLKELKYIGLMKELQSNNYDWSKIPSASGVYVIVYKQLNRPRFLVKGTGGFFKKKNPNVPIEKLNDKWINFELNEDRIVYIGQSSNLRKRMKLSVRFGKGSPVGKWGGRYIWQIGGANKLEVYFKETDASREKEKQLIRSFKNSHGERLPFANLQG